MSRVTIIMYHYVRSLKYSEYPEIKGLDVKDFKEQIQYILKYYNVIRMEELIEVIKNNKKLPDNSLLLTFDDAYKDHFEFVFPILNKIGIQGSFFPSAKAIQESRVLNVNKIHFILASIKNKKQIISDISILLNKFREEYCLKDNEYYYQKLAVSNRFDVKEVVFIKKILQKELPEKLRNFIVNYLFNKYVSEDEESFSRKLYMDIDQLKYLKKSGMFIGSHGYRHSWLDILTERQQEEDINLSLKFLENIGCDIKNFVMCYPFGGYNDILLSLLKKRGCVLALTTRVGIADLSTDHHLALPRLDTNDLPKNKLSGPNEWTLKIIDK